MHLRHEVHDTLLRDFCFAALNLETPCTQDHESCCIVGVSEREMCPWAISKYFGDLVSNTSD
jgi:hypothetical protein